MSGGAGVGGIGSGAVPDGTGVSRFITTGRLVSPSPQNSTFYDERYAQYRDLYERLRPLFPRMARH